MQNIWLRNYILIIIFFKLQNTTCNDIQTETIITNAKQADGFGSQFQAIIATVIYAELKHKKYAYSPFTTMEHDYNNDCDFIAKKEQLINFIGNFEIVDKSSAFKHYSALPYYDLKSTSNSYLCSSTISKNN